ncbi:MAG: hypothetical protein OXM01_13680 [Gemmatimonadota bacterium]|nr:hypothetical protein [Gemmatimonadota bacterium]
MEIRAARTSQDSGPVEPSLEQKCTPSTITDDLVEVTCSYNFQFRSGASDVATATIVYNIDYTLIGDAPLEASDIEQFARANGAYHSWPFVREAIYGLTSKMGFNAYTLPVLSFLKSERRARTQRPDAPESRTSSSQRVTGGAKGDG